MTSSAGYILNFHLRSSLQSLWIHVMFFILKKGEENDCFLFLFFRENEKKDTDSRTRKVHSIFVYSFLLRELGARSRWTRWSLEEATHLDWLGALRISFLHLALIGRTARDCLRATCGFQVPRACTPFGPAPMVEGAPSACPFLLLLGVFDGFSNLQICCFIASRKAILIEFSDSEYDLGLVGSEWFTQARMPDERWMEEEWAND